MATGKRGVCAPEIMTLRGRAGAYALHAKYDSRQTAKKGQNGLQRKLARSFDPDGVIERGDPQEFARRLQSAMKAHMSSVALERVRRAQERAAVEEARRQLQQDDAA